MTEPEQAPIADAIAGLATKQDIRRLVTREDLYRALLIQAVVFAVIVGAIVALLTRL